MPSLEACEPWVFRRNLLLSVCPVELSAMHLLLLSAEEDTLMPCGPFGCTAAAVCVLWFNSLPNTECASCGLGLLALCVCAQQRCWIWKSQGGCRRFRGVVSKGPAQLLPQTQDELKPSLTCSPCPCQGLCLVPAGAQDLKEKEHAGREFHPNLVWFCKMLNRAGYLTECVISLNYPVYQNRAPSLASLKYALKWSVEQLWAIQETKTLSCFFSIARTCETFIFLNLKKKKISVNFPSFVHCRPWIRFQVTICCLERYSRKS